MNDTPPPIGRIRPRRLRGSAALRELAAETSLDRARLVMPHFVLPRDAGCEPVESLPGIARLGVNDLVRQVEADLSLGLKSVLLFGLAPDGAKDAHGTHSHDASGAAPAAVRALKAAFGADLCVMTDVCLCAYTDHGHCGFVEGGKVVNDPSLNALARMAVAHAEAGADVVAPSDMMDGRVGALRDALDEHGFADTALMSYAVKYASAYYGPFRDAAGSAPSSGVDAPRDRKTYQMDPRNVREAEREAACDEAEGADLLMVKPALAYLDVIARVRAVSRLPLAAYNVSGEYAQVKAAASNGWIDEGAVVHENLLAMTRAGADVLITYHARDAAQGGWL